MLKNYTITFTKVNTAELLESEIDETALLPNQVLVKTRASAISRGTERANITADPNVNIGAPSDMSKYFPRVLGYSSAGDVVAVGGNVKNVKAGDRVAMFWSKHTLYNLINDDQVVKMSDANTYSDGAMAMIGTFPLAAIRKTSLEIGEPAMVMGLGILGQLAIEELHAAGAAPVIAVDPTASRRELALKRGADYTFDPTQPDFAENVKAVTGGIKVCIEVTGVGKGLDQALDCMARFGRVALLGCTRSSDFTIDYYKKVHGPGIALFGAHTMARPIAESSHGLYTHNDDIAALLKLCELKRINLGGIVEEVHSPAECTEVYNRVVFEKDFPTVVQFDWDKLGK